MPTFTHATHAQPSLSNFPKWDSISASRPTHAGRPCGNESFPLPPKIKLPNSHSVRYTCQFEQYLPHTQNERRAHPNWAPTKEPTMSCWRYTPTPKQDRFQDLLEAICLEFLHTNLTKKNNYHCYSNKPQLLSAEVVLCTHKTTILCQFGLFFVTSLPNHIFINSQPFLVGNVSHRTFLPTFFHLILDHIVPC